MATPDLAAIKKQIEFYFSDSNFPTDNFLRGEADKDPQGYVKLQVLGTFNRLKKLTTNVQDLASAIEDSEIVKLNEDKTAIKRVSELPESDVVADRSIYAKGFNTEWKIEDIEKFYTDKGFKVLSIRQRRYKDGKFKGTCFVEFDSEEAAKKAREEVNECEDQKLETDTKKDFLEKKKKQRIEYLQKKKAKATAAPADNDNAEPGEKRKAESNEDEEPAKRQKTEDSWQKGLIVEMTNLNEETTRNDLKTFVNQWAEARWVDIEDGKAMVRFKEGQQESVQKLLSTVKDEKKEIGGKVPEMRVLEDEEEENHWKSLNEARAQNSGDGRGRGRGRGRRGRGRGRGRPRK